MRQKSGAREKTSNNFFKLHCGNCIQNISDSLEMKPQPMLHLQPRVSDTVARHASKVNNNTADKNNSEQRNSLKICLYDGHKLQTITNSTAKTYKLNHSLLTTIIWSFIFYIRCPIYMTFEAHSLTQASWTIYMLHIIFVFFPCFVLFGSCFTAVG